MLLPKVETPFGIGAVPSENSIGPGFALQGRTIASLRAMLAVLRALEEFVANLFKSRSRFEAENLLLRHELAIALRRAPPCLSLHGSDRALLVGITRLWPSVLDAIQVVQPETVLRWHRADFKVFWHWKSRQKAGRPRIDRGLRDLIRRMIRENPLWGASRIHGELLMLGFEVAQSTVSKYMARPSRPPSQSWKTFLRNHDLCVVPTLTFERLFAFLVLGHGRRELLWFEVTRYPTAKCLARQITEAFPWNSAPAYLVRDNDRAYGHVFTSRVRTMGIRDRPISPGSPWQNGIGAFHRHIAPRVLGSGGDLQRDAPAEYSFRLCGILQSSADALSATERCAVTSSSPTLWPHTCDWDPGWTTRPICPDMIFGKDSTHTFGTHVPVKEPSTASLMDLPGQRARSGPS